ncbi:unnamed protein product [Orchesella dallaii]|uniref:Secreted protein n=1 Tax=Orchesella dallaii TaxID=48710 RepID=A0ABP1PJA0_9HEXA
MQISHHFASSVRKNICMTFPSSVPAHFLLALPLLLIGAVSTKKIGDRTDVPSYTVVGGRGESWAEVRRDWSHFSFSFSARGSDDIFTTMRPINSVQLCA